MTRGARISLFLLAALGLATLLAWGFAGLPSFGGNGHTYSHLLNHVVVPERHTSNVVSAVVFDYRGIDTLGEEFILFAAVTGVVLLLRPAERKEPRGRSTANEALRTVGGFAVGIGMVVGLWLIAFGYVTPGGGFQGGVAVASSTVLLCFAANFTAFSPLGSVTLLDPLEALGAGGYAIIGVAALLSGLPFLTNLLGPGSTGTLESGGSIAFLNWATGLEVSAALLVLYSEFLREHLMPIAEAHE